MYLGICKSSHKKRRSRVQSRTDNDYQTFQNIHRNYCNHCYSMYRSSLDWIISHYWISVSWILHQHLDPTC